MAGGSCAAVPIKDADLLKCIATMKPQQPAAEGIYLLKGEQGMLYHKQSGQSLTVSLDSGNYLLYQIDEKTGSTTRPQNVKREVTLTGKGVFLIRKK
jgi:hypothetical protein